MEPPYSPGDAAVYLSVESKGLRVQQTVVLSIDRDDRGGWAVETVHGSDVVDGQGEGPSIVPFDQEMNELVERRGMSFVQPWVHEDGFRHLGRLHDFDRSHDRRPDLGR